MDAQIEETLTIIGDLFNWILVGIALSFLTMWIWNWLMPQLFELPLINFWQALGINVLSNILFKSHNFSFVKYKNEK